MRVVLVLVSLLVGPVLSSVDEHLETVLAVTQCRASCLDQFSHVIRTEDNCRKESNCLMCWETCQMLIDNFKIWGPLCAVPDICSSGCQKTCSFIETRKNESIGSSSPILLRSVYEPHTDRVSLEWVPDHDLESESTVLYSVLLKDDNQKWHQIAQTTSHVVHIKRGLLSRNTSIRVIAANATSQVSDSETSYLDSYVTGSTYQKTGRSGNSLWKPQLESMVQSETSVGLLTTITWPIKQDKAESTQYEVSWNVIDDSMEITGHLYTSNNVAVLTLWPDSLYSVQVNSYTSEKDLHSQSEPLIIDTRNSYRDTSTTVLCNTVPGEKMVVNAFAFLSAFFLTFLILAFIWILKCRKGNLTESSCDVKEFDDRAAMLGCQVHFVRKSPRTQGNVIKSQDIKNSLKIPVTIKSEIFHIV